MGAFYVQCARGPPSSIDADENVPACDLHVGRSIGHTTLVRLRNIGREAALSTDAERKGALRTATRSSTR